MKDKNMPIIKPISDLRNKSNEISELVNSSDAPIFITKNGAGDMVVMSMVHYSKLQLKLDLLSKLSIAQSKNLALTSFYHRIKARKGALGAIKATARKIAVIFYNVITKGIVFVEQGIKLYEQKFKELS